MKWLIPISLAALGGTARADQCAWVDKHVAERAHELVAQAPNVIAFCEPCGDQAPGAPVAVTSYAIGEPDSGFGELSINGASVDLAYTYVQTSPTEYTNLALLAGCPATGVSPSLEVAAETQHGVLVTASDKPVAPVAAVAPVVPVAPVVRDAPVPLVQLPPVYVQTTTRYDFAWSVVALGAGGGAALGSLVTLLALASRRRHAMRPRANELR